MTAAGDTASLKGYYRFHSLIYDATRWSFLFGRGRILRELPACCPSPNRILEVGCGTGRNLKTLCELYPRATITGLDLSEDMLRIARKKLAPFGDRVQWRQQIYDQPISTGKPFDLILFSYALSMFNPGWDGAIRAALADLSGSGCLGVVDFESSPLGWFRRWMGVNHVRMESHLLPFLREHSHPVVDRVLPAYGGCWNYFLFVGHQAGT